MVAHCKTNKACAVHGTSVWIVEKFLPIPCCHSDPVLKYCKICMTCRPDIIHGKIEPGNSWQPSCWAYKEWNTEWDYIWQLWHWHWKSQLSVSSGLIAGSLNLFLWLKLQARYAAASRCLTVIQGFPDLSISPGLLNYNGYCTPVYLIDLPAPKQHLCRQL